MVFSWSHLPVFAYVKCRIPVKLLQGPWKTDKIQFLRFLLWTSSMTVEWADPDTMKIALAGRQEAILEHNLEAVELFNHNRRLGKVPGLDQVRFAVVDGGCDRSIVYDLMATARSWGLRGTGWECEILDNWCESRPNDPKAKWLALKLQELRSTVHGIDTTSRTEKSPINRQVGLKSYREFGQLDPNTGDYDNIDGDRLTIGNHHWNRVSDIVKFSFPWMGSSDDLHVYVL